MKLPSSVQPVTELVSNGAAARPNTPGREWWMRQVQVPSHLREVEASYRAIAALFGYTGDLTTWLVHNGFGLPEARAMYPWSATRFDDGAVIENDQPLPECLVFGVPIIVPAGYNLTATEQIKMLRNLGRQFNLPPHHLHEFGSAPLVAGFLGANNEVNDRPVPLNTWVRTSSQNLGEGGGRVKLGLSAAGQVYWDIFGYGGAARPNIGCLALGIEVLGNTPSLL